MALAIRHGRYCLFFIALVVKFGEPIFLICTTLETNKITCAQAFSYIYT